MFEYLPAPWPRYWLLGLLAVWALLLFGGFLFGGSPEAARRMPTWTRMASSVTLVAAGFSWYLVSRDYDVGRYGLFIALGITFGLLGDLWLAGLLPGGRSVLGGIAAFSAGHLFYIWGMWQFASTHGLDTAVPRGAALAVWLLVGLLGWYFMVFRGATPTALHWAALGYALLLASTAGVATGMALQSSLFVPLALGAALFLLSDLILAGELFSGLRFPYIGDVIWLTYGPGQMLIVYSVGAALRFAGGSG